MIILRIPLTILKNAQFISLRYRKTKRCSKKIAKNPYYCSDVAISRLTSQLSLKEIEAGAKKLSEELAAKEAEGYNRLLDKKFIDQLVDIVPAAK